MQLVTPQIEKSLASGSFIRKMFTKGLELKAQFGADNVFDFSLGNPDVPPPAAAKAALEAIAVEAVKPLGVGYCPNSGIPAVRAKMADFLSRQQACAVTADQVVMTVGAAGAIVSFFRAVIEPGDEVLVPAPYFVEYGQYCGHFGGVLKSVNSLEPDFRLDLAAIKAAITPKTRAILLNSPNNPTGTIYPKTDLEAVAAIVEETNAARGEGRRPLFILSDEPYRAFAYDGAEVPPMLPISKWTCVLGSFSKSLSLPGERIGYFVANPAMPDVEKLITAVTLTNRTLGFVNAPVIGQRLAAAIVEETVDLSIYERRRAAMTKVLDEAGIEYCPPKGAFYIFAKSPVADEFKFVEALTAENVLVVPGSGFGYPGYVRLCYAIDEQVILRSAAGFKRAMEKFA